MPLPPDVRAVKAGSRVYYYHRPTKTRLPDDPDSPEFADAIAAAVAADRSPQGTIGALIVEYRRTEQFRDMGKDTRAYYDRMLELLRPMEAMPIAEFRRRHVIKIKNALAEARGSSTATHFISVMSVLMRFAVDMEYREFNPCIGIKRKKGGSYRAWSEATSAFAITPGNLPEQFRRAVVLGLFTGQRAGDCISMRWDALSDGGVNVKQAKTGTEIWIPLHPALATELGTWDRNAVTILTTSRGAPWGSPSSFHAAMHRELRRHIEFSGLVFHGTRKAAATRLAEAGCSTKEIASVTGHRSLQMVELYTRDAEQKTLATAAIHRLHQHQKNRG
jgi:integrase